MTRERIVLVDALGFVGERSARSLKNLTDEEFFWEPVAQCWSIRSRRPGEAPGSPTCVGRGEFVMDDAPEDPDPPPFTTIAWRLGHLLLINRMFANHLLGSRDLTFDDVEIPTGARDGVDAWRTSYTEYSDLLRATTDAALEQELQVSWGARKKQTLREWSLVLLHENVHHLAEVGVVRDLFRQRSPGPGIFPGLT